MKYALGNMLNGAGSLNPDGLSLDLQFATDKTLAARKGPTPVFTRASTATFVGSNGLIQSAAINAARFDHDPVTLASRGLLIEEGRTNLFARSAEFDNGYWTKSELSISADNEISPDGGMNADTITAVIQAPSIYRPVACVASTVYTLSFYVKLGTLTAAAYKFAVRDDTNGVFIDGAITPNITPVTTEWRRVTYTFTTPVGCILVRPYLIRAGIATTGTFYLWGAQLEAGSFPTSYIPTTTTASVVRSADVCSITGANFTSFYNQSEGTIIGQGIVDTVGVGIVFPTFANFNDGTANNRVALGATNSGNEAVRPIVVAAGSTVFNNSIGTSSAGQSRKVGMVYKQNDFIAAHNGTLTAADNTGNVPSGINRVSFDTSFFVGTISAIRYYKKRLPNAKLQAITT